jgi:hypothetical protein
MAQAPRNLNYLNYKWIIIYNNNNNINQQHLRAKQHIARKRDICINNTNHSLVKDNINNYSVAPTLCHGKGDNNTVTTRV